MGQEPQSINQEFKDNRLNNFVGKPQDERERDAFESMVREGMATARAMGKDVTEDEVRAQMREIIEPADRKMHEGGYENNESAAPQKTEDSIVIDAEEICNQIKEEKE